MKEDSTPTTILETERLRLRMFTLHDAPFIIQLLNSPGWLQYIGDRNIKTSEQAKTYLHNGPLQSYRDHGFGLSMVELKNDQTAIGMCGLIKRDNLENPDIGFAFLPAYTGKGYGFEIAKATLDYAQKVLHLPVVSGITLPANKASIGLLEKIGMVYIKTIPSSDGGEELLLYSKEQ